MSASGQLRHRSAAHERRATFSAWAMSILFAVIAATSFAVDQTVVSSLAARGELGQPLDEFAPVRLIRSLIDSASDRLNQVE